MNRNFFRRNFSIFKGTSKDVEIIFSFRDSEPYEMKEDDSLILKVLDYRNDDNVVIEKEIKGSSLFSFIPSDTEELDVGFYRYNIKFIPGEEDNVYEVVAPSVFHIEAGE